MITATQRVERAAGRLFKESFTRTICQPFDLTQLPLILCTWLPLNPQEHVLNYVAHYTVHDGWSLDVFLRELLALHKAIARESTPQTGGQR
jgi:hypothetical protein